MIARQGEGKQMTTKTLWWIARKHVQLTRDTGGIRYSQSHTRFCSLLYVPISGRNDYFNLQSPLVSRFCHGAENAVYLRLNFYSVILAKGAAHPGWFNTDCVDDQVTIFVSNRVKSIALKRGISGDCLPSFHCIILFRSHTDDSTSLFKASMFGRGFACRPKPTTTSESEFFNFSFFFTLLEDQNGTGSWGRISKQAHKSRNRKGIVCWYKHGWLKFGRASLFSRFVLWNEISNLVTTANGVCPSCAQLVQRNVTMVYESSLRDCL